MPPPAYGLVYLIEGLPLYKIGRTRNLPKRLNDLQASSPAPLKVLCILQTVCMQKLEQQLHRKYKHKRIHGEWFRLSESDINEIMAHPLRIEESEISESLKAANATRKYKISSIS